MVWERYNRIRRSQILLVVEYAPDIFEGRHSSDAIGGRPLLIIH